MAGEMVVRGILVVAIGALCWGQQDRLIRVEFKQLNDLVRLGERERVLEKVKDQGGKIGALVVDKIPGMHFAHSVETMRNEAPKCLQTMTRLPKVKLSDGSTRKTFATEDGSDYPKCLKDSLKNIGQAFDNVEKVMSDLVNVVAQKNLTFIRNKKQDHEFLNDLPHKDHLHVYEKMTKNHGDHSKETSDYLVPFHVDNGLFLLITPFPDLGLEVETSQGEVISTSDLPSDSILVLFGLGLTDWLFQQDSDMKGLFYPVPHAVPSLASSDLETRTVYARMKVAAPDAKPFINAKTNYEKIKDFEEVFLGSSSRKWKDSQICSVNLANRDPWLKAMDSNCAEGEAYCWMGCYPLPKECPIVSDARCFSTVTNVTCSTEVDGKPMDPTCKWECLPETKSKFKTSEYCNGKMDMLMFGFDVSGKKENPCIILFFNSWTLDTKWKFALGCLGVMVLGFAIEALIAFRRQLSRRKRTFIDLTSRTRKILTLASFGLNLILGYLAMLVAMTYSIELFTFVVIGLIIGHACFNMNSAVGESIDPCCATSQNDLGKGKRRKSDCRIALNDDNSDSKPISTIEDEALALVPNGGCCSNLASPKATSESKTASDTCSSINTVSTQVV